MLKLYKLALAVALLRIAIPGAIAGTFTGGGGPNTENGRDQEEMRSGFGSGSGSIDESPEIPSSTSPKKKKDEKAKEAKSEIDGHRNDEE